MSKSMDINPLIADLHKYKDELVGAMEICLGLGDKVIVKKGVIDPDFAICIEGWTGEIAQIGRDSDSRPSYFIKWDNGTVVTMSPEHIAACDRENLVHTCMFLAESDIEVQSIKPDK